MSSHLAPEALGSILTDAINSSLLWTLDRRWHCDIEVLVDNDGAKVCFLFI
jgi:hypothetical protein